MLPRILKRGAVACLYKPFSESALLQAVNDAFERPPPEGRT